MRDCIDLGSSPYGETCAQVGTEDYVFRAKRECKVYISQLRRCMGEEPNGAELRVKSNPHDFGSYLSVVCYFDSDNQAATEYAFRCEAQGPESWDEQAFVELAQTERSAS